MDREQVPVYFTIDLDCLDPSELNIVGADVNELAPMLDPSGVSTATACKVVRELLLAVAK